MEGRCAISGARYRTYRLGAQVNDGIQNIDGIENRFFVQGRMEILSLLNELILRREAVTVNFNGGTERLLTKLLEVRDKVLIFELGGDPDTNLRLLQCRDCTFVARPDGIRVQFTGGQVRRISWGGSGAFRIALPERVARVQRQLSFRVPIPAQQQMNVELFSDGGASLGEWPVHDLSVGGLGIATEVQAQLEFSENVARVNLRLPEHGEIDCAVTLRHATGLPTDESSPPYRVGVEFIDLPEQMGAAIQRYIIKTEHERRSRIEEDYASDA